MATFTKRPSGWQAQVARKGIRAAKTFRTKREAQDWAARQEHLIMAGEGVYGHGTVGDMCERYAREVSPGKRGGRWEMIRLEAIRRDALATVHAKNLTTQDVAAWRDRRLREVAPSTVNRELNLISAVFTRAVKEWGALSKNPVSDVRRPRNPEPRTRRVLPGEIERLEAAAKSNGERMAVRAFLFAIETAMRAGEICGLQRDRITGAVAHLPMTKNGTARDVPLSSAALTLLDDLDDDLFGITPGYLDTTFRRLRARAGIEGLNFHDSRAEATTRLAAKVDVLTLARITGHKDLSMLRRYYRESPADIARRLG